MARDLEPKCKRCRRVGEKLFLKGERCDSSKCALVKRKYPPGVHGPKQRVRLSEYGLQLREKQKAKRFYGLLERQFRNYFLKARRMKGDAGYNFLILLEHRLDNVIYKAGVFKSRNLARQAISHRHILVNEKKVSIPSYNVKIGDEIRVKEKGFKTNFLEVFKNKEKQKDLPSWLIFEKDKEALKVISAGGEEDLPRNIDVRLIIEFYSK